MIEPRPPEPRAGGAFIALAVLAGAVAGVAMGQATIGVLAGAAAGIAAAALLWWRERARRRGG